MADEKEFLAEILERFTEAVRNLLHPSLYKRTLREIGTDLGRKVAGHVDRPHTASHPFTEEDYLRCGQWMKTHWGWNHDMRVQAKGKIDVKIPLCPFGKLATDESQVCQIEAGILGGIAGDQFGYGKVVIQRGSGLPPRDCRLTVYLERTPESLTTEGPTFMAGHIGEKNGREIGADTSLVAQLTQRERQIIKLIGEGLSDKKIAETLRLSVRTVEGHIARIRDKTALRSRSALIRFALRTNALN